MGIHSNIKLCYTTSTLYKVSLPVALPQITDVTPTIRQRFPFAVHKCKFFPSFPGGRSPFTYYRFYLI